MLTETGRVVAVEPDSLWVETIRRSTCGSCAVQKGCGHGLINQMSDGSRSYVRVLPGKLAPSACSIDDEVRISIPEDVIVRGSLIVYIVPLLMMLAGIWYALHLSYRRGEVLEKLRVTADQVHLIRYTPGGKPLDHGSRDPFARSGSGRGGAPRPRSRCDHFGPFGLASNSHRI